MARATRRNLNNILFSIFWWFVQKLSPKSGEKLLYWGLKSGAFPNTARRDPMLATRVMDMDFKSPIGIGAGFDKQTGVIDDLIFMGAGFGEFGPYTLEHESPTTEQYYLPRDKAIVTQSLGYKNIGVLNVIPTLINRRYLPNTIGINLTITSEFEGENVKQGRLMSYAEEFAIMVRKVAPYCDVITLDFSHPEVELSHFLVDRSTIVPMLKDLKRVIGEVAPIQQPKLLIKIPMSLTQMEIPMVCQNLVEAEVDAVVVGGAISLSHTKVHLSKSYSVGMLSGAPVKKYVTELISKVHQFTKGAIPIVACGGVFSGQDAYEHIAAGASLVQIATVIRFEGPGAVTRINRELAMVLRSKGLSSVSEAVGVDFY